METKAQTDMGELTLEWDTGSQANILRRPNAPASKADGDELPRVQSRRFALGDVDFGPIVAPADEYSFREAGRLQPGSVLR